MKVGMHLKILINTISILSGTALYFLVVHQFTMALIVGIVSAVYGNVYGSYISKRAVREIPNMIMSFFVTKKEKEKTLNILQELK